MTKLVRVSDGSYEKLSVLAGKLQVEVRKIVSLDDAVAFLLASHEGKTAGFVKKLKNRPSRGRKRQISAKQHSKTGAGRRHPEHFRSVS